MRPKEAETKLSHYFKNDPNNIFMQYKARKLKMPSKKPKTPVEEEPEQTERELEEK